MSRRKKLALLAMGLIVVVLLAGCAPSATREIDPNNGVWDKYFVYPLSWSLDNLADIFWGQYAISILIVTIVIRFIVLPLTLKQYRSSKEMQAIQPELLKLKTKYKDDPKKQQEETMKLFQQHGINPMAGCFPMLIQMPILFALYQAIYYNDHIREHSFLWLELGAKDPYYILPILAAFTTFLQQKVMSANMTQQMKGMMFIFPILIFVMSMQFPAALPLYWLYGNIFSIVQSYFIYGKGKEKLENKRASKKGETSK